MKHYTHLALIDTERAVEMLPDFQSYPITNEAVKTGTDDLIAQKGFQNEVEKGSEIGDEFQFFIGIDCQSEEHTSKQDDLEHFIQPLDNKRFGIVCHQNDKCPGLESNQHEPKLTSPSS